MGPQHFFFSAEASFRLIKVYSKSVLSVLFKTKFRLINTTFEAGLTVYAFYVLVVGQWNENQAFNKHGRVENAGLYLKYSQEN